MKNAIWLLGRKEMVMWLLERRKQNVNVVSGRYSSHKGGYILNESKYYLKVVYVFKEMIKNILYPVKSTKNLIEVVTKADLTV
jgi:hypothetical protein